MEIRPDKKLITKSWLILISLSVVIVLFACLLHIIPVLDSDIDFEQFSFYMWRIVFIVIILMWMIAAPIIILWIKN